MQQSRATGFILPSVLLRSVLLRSILSSVALLLVVTACSQAVDGVRLADGSVVSFDDWRGRWLIINYWAEWCGPCRKEIPELNRLHRDHPDDVVVLGVNYDSLTGSGLTDLMDEMGIEFRILQADPRERWAVPLPEVLPSTLVVDPEGALKEVLVGPHTYESFSRALGLTTAL